MGPRFSRCAYSVIVDTDTFDAQAVENPGALSPLGLNASPGQSFGPGMGRSVGRGRDGRRERGKW